MKRYKLFKNLLREQIRGIKKSFIDVSIVISIIYNIGVLRSNKKKKKEKIINSYCSFIWYETFNSNKYVEWSIFYSYRNAKDCIILLGLKWMNEFPQFTKNDFE